VSIDAALVASAGFARDDELGPPDVSASPRVRVASWEAWRSADGGGHLVAACFDVTTGGWTPDADELARAKLHETIAATATRAIGFGELSVRAEGSAEAGHPAVTFRTYEGHEGALVARSAQGFVRAAEPTLASCFALCGDRAVPSRCADPARGARFSRDFVPAPAPGAGLQALGALVHHPVEAAWGGGALLALLGALAVATRKRPKRRRLR
jgi:hypothetical protein